jgi:hypothetical protein
VQVSDNGSTWNPVVQARGNTADSSTHPVDTDGRYVRLTVLTPTSNGDAAARLYELEVRP